MVKVFIIISIILSLITSPWGDFKFFYDAAINLRTGHNPYLVDGFYSPIHLLLYILPLSFLPIELATRVNTFIASMVFLYALRKRLYLFITPPILWSLFISNLEWTAVLATLINPLFGIPLALVKPQIGWFLAIYLSILSFYTIGKIKTLFMVSLMAISFLITVSFHPIWNSVLGASWNASLFPFSLIIGIPLIILAFKNKNKNQALAAGIFFSPYVNFISWSVTLPWLSEHKKTSILIFISRLFIWT